MCCKGLENLLMKKKPTDRIRNILIVNVHSASNAGDYALLYQTINYLKQSLGDLKINILSNWPNELLLQELANSVIGSPWWVTGIWNKKKRPRFQVLSFFISFLYLLLYKLRVFKQSLPKNWLQIFDAFTNADLVVAVSGNQLFSSGRLGWPLPVIAYPIYLAKTFRKPAIIFPQSVGPLRTSTERHIVRYVYNNVEKLFIRDIEFNEAHSITENLKIKSQFHARYCLYFSTFKTRGC